MPFIPAVPANQIISSSITSAQPSPQNMTITTPISPTQNQALPSTLSTVAFIPAVPAIPSIGPVVCNPRNPAYSDIPADNGIAKHKGCFSPVRVAAINATLTQMAINNINQNRIMESTSGNLTQAYTDFKGVTYFMNIGWIPGCTAFAQQNPAELNDRGWTGQQVLNSTYAECNNHGIGGFRDVGCLRFGFFPITIKGVFASPPRFDLYWAVQQFCLCAGKVCSD